MNGQRYRIDFERKPRTDEVAIWLTDSSGGITPVEELEDNHQADVSYIVWCALCEKAPEWARD